MSPRARSTVPVNPSSSISSFMSTHLHVDIYAVIEASLSSVKYAIYHAVGHWTGNRIGYHDATATSYLRTVTAGFIGGAIFTVPYLFFPGWNDSLNNPDVDADLDLSQVDWFRYLVAEIFYSTIAGGVGGMVLGHGRVDGLPAGMVDGLFGPVILYSSLYLLLKGGLWVVACL